jgi:MoaA/NifB/PqqE/SkfB family radical SAM enzyme
MVLLRTNAVMRFPVPGRRVISRNRMDKWGKILNFSYSFSRKRLVHLNLQILYQCNFQCKICDFWGEPYKSMPMLSAADVRTIVEKLRSIGPMIVSIGGGEPLLHPDLLDIIRILKQHHFPVMICNGWYITPELARELFRAGLYEISVSLDYASPEKHDALRGMPGAFERACYALTTLMECRVSPDQRVHMIAVVMDDNLDQIESLIQLARKLGVTFLVTLYSHGRGSKSPRPAQRNVSADLLELKRKYPDFVALRGYLARFSAASNAGTGVMPCYAGKNLFNIDSSGNVSRCIDRMDDVAGNMLTDDPTAIARELLKQQKRNDCGDCWTSCRGNFETLMYGPDRFLNMLDGYRMLKSIPLKK